MPTFSFKNPPEDIAFAKPKAVRLGAASCTTGSWAKVLEAVAKAVLRDAHYRKKARTALAELGATGEKRLLRRPMELEHGLWLEGNRAASDIVGRVRRLLAGCGYPLGSAVVEYEPAPRNPPISSKGRSTPARPHAATNDPTKAFHPRKGEKAGAFARRMFADLLAEGRVPKDDFFACLDDNGGTKQVFGLLPGGHPLFSRKPMKSGANHRSWVEPFPTRFGFPVYVNSQWRTEHLGKLAALFEKWSRQDEPTVILPSIPVQMTLLGPPAPEQLTLFAATKPKAHQPSETTSESIRAYARRELYMALSGGWVPEEDFEKLLTMEGTKELLGYSMNSCPLFGLKPLVRRNGRRGCWSKPARYNGRRVYVNEFWTDRYRANLDRLLSRWRRVGPGVSSGGGRERIGAYAKRELHSALAEGRVPVADFERLLTMEGTKQLLGYSMKTCPLFSLTPMVRRDGRPGSWSQPAHYKGKQVFINGYWMERHRANLKRLLKRWRKSSRRGTTGDAGEKIGAFAKRELYSALLEGRVPPDDFRTLSTPEGTLQLLGVNLCNLPLFSDKPLLDEHGWGRGWNAGVAIGMKKVYVNCQWYEAYRPQLERLLRRWKREKTAHEKDEGLERFATDIREHWPEGFDFSDGAMRLVESRCGKMTKGAKAALKAGMFHPRGRLWFCPENVAQAEVRDAVVAAAKQLVGVWGLVSVGVLAECLDVPGTKLNDLQEREAFGTFLVCRSGFSVCKLEGGNYVTLAGGAAVEETAETVCSLIREFIEDHGGAVRAEVILEEFKNLNERSLSDLMARWEPDAIPERDENGVLSFKLLSEYYLPEDFGEALEEGVARAEDEGTPLTAAWMAAFLSARYGCDFAEDYALDPAGSLKWAIGAVWHEAGKHCPRRWMGEGARARFLEGKEQNGENPPPLDLPSQVEATFPGVFTNEDYWQYTVGNYGLSDHREAKIAQLGYIAPCFVRFDRDHWMSVAAFRAATGWNEKTADTVTNVLRAALGTAAMVPVASLGASVTDSLPDLVLHANDEDMALRWTPELVASVAALLCPGVCVANHGVAPFAVTALLVPKPVSTKDVFAYAMRLYCARNPYRRDVREAFAFLQANNIRFRFTPRARAEIEEFLAREVD